MSTRRGSFGNQSYHTSYGVEGGADIGVTAASIGGTAQSMYDSASIYASCPGSTSSLRNPSLPNASTGKKTYETSEFVSPPLEGYDSPASVRSGLSNNTGRSIGGTSSLANTANSGPNSTTKSDLKSKRSNDGRSNSRGYGIPVANSNNSTQRLGNTQQSGSTMRDAQSNFERTLSQTSLGGHEFEDAYSEYNADSSGRHRRTQEHQQTQDLRHVGLLNLQQPHLQENLQPPRLNNEPIRADDEPMRSNNRSYQKTSDIEEFRPRTSVEELRRSIEEKTKYHAEEKTPNQGFRKLQINPHEGNALFPPKKNSRKPTPPAPSTGFGSGYYGGSYSSSVNHSGYNGSNQSNSGYSGCSTGVSNPSTNNVRITPPSSSGSMKITPATHVRVTPPASASNVKVVPNLLSVPVAHNMGPNMVPCTPRDVYEVPLTARFGGCSPHDEFNDGRMTARFGGSPDNNNQNYKPGRVSHVASTGRIEQIDDTVANIHPQIIFNAQSDSQPCRESPVGDDPSIPSVSINTMNVNASYMSASHVMGSSHFMGGNGANDITSGLRRTPRESSARGSTPEKRSPMISHKRSPARSPPINSRASPTGNFLQKRSSPGITMRSAGQRTSPNGFGQTSSQTAFQTQISPGTAERRVRELKKEYLNLRSPQAGDQESYISDVIPEENRDSSKESPAVQMSLREIDISSIHNNSSPNRFCDMSVEALSNKLKLTPEHPPDHYRARNQNNSENNPARGANNNNDHQNFGANNNHLNHSFVSTMSQKTQSQNQAGANKNVPQVSALKVVPVAKFNSNNVANHSKNSANHRNSLAFLQEKRKVSSIKEMFQSNIGIPRIGAEQKTSTLTDRMSGLDRPGPGGKMSTTDQQKMSSVGSRIVAARSGIDGPFGGPTKNSWAQSSPLECSELAAVFENRKSSQVMDNISDNLASTPKTSVTSTVVAGQHTTVCDTSGMMPATHPQLLGPSYSNVKPFSRTKRLSPTKRIGHGRHQTANRSPPAVSYDRYGLAPSPPNLRNTGDSPLLPPNPHARMTIEYPQQSNIAYQKQQANEAYKQHREWGLGPQLGQPVGRHGPRLQQVRQGSPGERASSQRNFLRDNVKADYHSPTKKANKFNVGIAKNITPPIPSYTMTPPLLTPQQEQRLTPPSSQNPPLNRDGMSTGDPIVSRDATEVHGGTTHARLLGTRTQDAMQAGTQDAMHTNTRDSATDNNAASRDGGGGGARLTRDRLAQSQMSQQSHLCVALMDTQGFVTQCKRSQAEMARLYGISPQRVSTKQHDNGVSSRRDDVQRGTYDNNVSPQLSNHESSYSSASNQTIRSAQKLSNQKKATNLSNQVEKQSFVNQSHPSNDPRSNHSNLQSFHVLTDNHSTPPSNKLSTNAEMVLKVTRQIEHVKSSHRNRTPQRNRETRELARTLKSITKSAFIGNHPRVSDTVQKFLSQCKDNGLLDSAGNSINNTTTNTISNTISNTITNTITNTFGSLNGGGIAALNTGGSVTVPVGGGPKIGGLTNAPGVSNTPGLTPGAQLPNAPGGYQKFASTPNPIGNGLTGNVLTSNGTIGTKNNLPGTFSSPVSINPPLISPMGNIPPPNVSPMPSSGKKKKLNDTIGKMKKSGIVKERLRNLFPSKSNLYPPQAPSPIYGDNSDEVLLYYDKISPDDSSTREGRLSGEEAKSSSCSASKVVNSADDFVNSANDTGVVESVNDNRGNAKSGDDARSSGNEAGRSSSDTNVYSDSNRGSGIGSNVGSNVFYNTAASSNMASSNAGSKYDIHKFENTDIGKKYGRSITPVKFAGNKLIMHKLKTSPGKSPMKKRSQLAQSALPKRSNMRSLQKRNEPGEANLLLQKRRAKSKNTEVRKSESPKKRGILSPSKKGYSPVKSNEKSLRSAEKLSQRSRNPLLELSPPSVTVNETISLPSSNSGNDIFAAGDSNLLANGNSAPKIDSIPKFGLSKGTMRSNSTGNTEVFPASTPCFPDTPRDNSVSCSESQSAQRPPGSSVVPNPPLGLFPMSSNSGGQNFGSNSGLNFATQNQNLVNGTQNLANPNVPQWQGGDKNLKETEDSTACDIGNNVDMMPHATPDFPRYRDINNGEIQLTVEKYPTGGYPMIDSNSKRGTIDTIILEPENSQTDAPQQGFPTLFPNELSNAMKSRGNVMNNRGSVEHCSEQHPGQQPFQLTNMRGSLEHFNTRGTVDTILPGRNSNRDTQMTENLHGSGAGFSGAGSGFRRGSNGNFFRQETGSELDATCDLYAQQSLLGSQLVMKNVLTPQKKMNDSFSTIIPSGWKPLHSEFGSIGSKGFQDFVAPRLSPQLLSAKKHLQMSEAKNGPDIRGPPTTGMGALQALQRLSDSNANSVAANTAGNGVGTMMNTPGNVNTLLGFARDRSRTPTGYSTALGSNAHPIDMKMGNMGPNMPSKSNVIPVSVTSVNMKGSVQHQMAPNSIMPNLGGVNLAGANTPAMPGMGFPKPTQNMDTVAFTPNTTDLQPGCQPMDSAGRDKSKDSSLQIPNLQSLVPKGIRPIESPFLNANGPPRHPSVQRQQSPVLSGAGRGSNTGSAVSVATSVPTAALSAGAALSTGSAVRMPVSPAPHSMQTSMQNLKTPMTADAMQTPVQMSTPAVPMSVVSMAMGNALQTPNSFLQTPGSATFLPSSDRVQQVDVRTVPISSVPLGIGQRGSMNSAYGDDLVPQSPGSGIAAGRRGLPKSSTNGLPKSSNITGGCRSVTPSAFRNSLQASLTKPSGLMRVNITPPPGLRMFENRLASGNKNAFSMGMRSPLIANPNARNSANPNPNPTASPVGGNVGPNTAQNMPPNVVNVSTKLPNVSNRPVQNGGNTIANAAGDMNVQNPSIPNATNATANANSAGTAVMIYGQHMMERDPSPVDSETMSQIRKGIDSVHASMVTSGLNKQNTPSMMNLNPNEVNLASARDSHYSFLPGSNPGFLVEGRRTVEIKRGAPENQPGNIPRQSAEVVNQISDARNSADSAQSAESGTSAQSGTSAESGTSAASGGTSMGKATSPAVSSAPASSPSGSDSSSSSSSSSSSAESAVDSAASKSALPSPASTIPDQLSRPAVVPTQLSGPAVVLTSSTVTPSTGAAAGITPSTGTSCTTTPGTTTATFISSTKIITDSSTSAAKVITDTVPSSSTGVASFSSNSTSSSSGARSYTAAPTSISAMGKRNSVEIVLEIEPSSSVENSPEFTKKTKFNVDELGPPDYDNLTISPTSLAITGRTTPLGATGQYTPALTTTPLLTKTVMTTTPAISNVQSNVQVTTPTISQSSPARYRIVAPPLHGKEASLERLNEEHPPSGPSVGNVSVGSNPENPLGKVSIGSNGSNPESTNPKPAKAKSRAFACGDMMLMCDMPGMGGSQLGTEKTPGHCGSQSVNIAKKTPIFKPEERRQKSPVPPKEVGRAKTPGSSSLQVPSSTRSPAGSRFVAPAGLSDRPAKTPTGATTQNLSRTRLILPSANPTPPRSVTPQAQGTKNAAQGTTNGVQQTTHAEATNGAQQNTQTQHGQPEENDKFTRRFKYGEWLNRQDKGSQRIASPVEGPNHEKNTAPSWPKKVTPSIVPPNSKGRQVVGSSSVQPSGLKQPTNFRSPQQTTRGSPQQLTRGSPHQFSGQSPKRLITRTSPQQVKRAVTPTTANDSMSNNRVNNLTPIQRVRAHPSPTQQRIREEIWGDNHQEIKDQIVSEMERHIKSQQLIRESPQCSPQSSPQFSPLSSPLSSPLPGIPGSRHHQHVPTPISTSKFTRNNTIQNFEKISLIGEGASANVYKVREKSTGKLFALKVLKKASVRGDMVHFLEREIDIHMSLPHHPNIVRFYDSFTDHSKIYLVLELCGRNLYEEMRSSLLSPSDEHSDGDMGAVKNDSGSSKQSVSGSKKISKDDSLVEQGCSIGQGSVAGSGNNNVQLQGSVVGSPMDDAGSNNVVTYSEAEACNIIQQLVTGFQFLHENKVLHGDIKLENIMRGSEGSRMGVSNQPDKPEVYKIADFGTSKKSEDLRRLTFCGTLDYLSPEIVCKSNTDEVDNNPYRGDLADSWALGIMLYELVCGYAPFEDDDHTVTVQRIRFGEITFPPHLSSECKQLIACLVRKNPVERLQLQDFWNTAFYKKYGK